MIGFDGKERPDDRCAWCYRPFATMRETGWSLDLMPMHEGCVLDAHRSRARQSTGYPPTPYALVKPKADRYYADTIATVKLAWRARLYHKVAAASLYDTLEATKKMVVASLMCCGAGYCAVEIDPANRMLIAKLRTGDLRFQVRLVDVMEALPRRCHICGRYYYPDAKETGVIQDDQTTLHCCHRCPPF